MAKNIAYVEHQQGSTKMIVYDGGEIEFQSGGVLDMQSGHKTYHKGYTTHGSLADGQFANYGHSIVVTAASSHKFRMDAPVAGIDKFITVYTTKVTMIHATTASGGTSPRFGAGHGGTTNAHVLMKFKQGQKMGSAGNTVHLRGFSSVEWLVMNAPSTVGCIFSTST